MTDATGLDDATIPHFSGETNPDAAVFLPKSHATNLVFPTLTDVEVPARIQ